MKVCTLDPAINGLRVVESAPSYAHAGKDVSQGQGERCFEVDHYRFGLTRRQSGLQSAEQLGVQVRCLGCHEDVVDWNDLPVHVKHDVEHLGEWPCV